MQPVAGARGINPVSITGSIHVACRRRVAAVLCSTNCPAEPRKPPDPLVITHVSVLPMTPDAAPLTDVTVTIRDGRIASIAPARKSWHGARAASTAVASG